MENKGRKPIILTPEEKALNEAIDRVYQKYGTDLSAFYRDVYDELTLKRQGSYNATKGERAL